MIKKPLDAPDDSLPEDYYDTFHGRGQDVQDLEDLLADRLPSNPGGASAPEPLPKP